MSFSRNHDLVTQDNLQSLLSNCQLFLAKESVHLFVLVTAQDQWCPFCLGCNVSATEPASLVADVVQ